MASTAASTSFVQCLNADPALGLSYIVAPPRMQRYLDVSTQIYKTCLKYVSPADIYPTLPLTRFSLM